VRETLARFPWPMLPSLALLIFLGFFVVLIVRVNLKSQKYKLQAAELLPLEEGEKI
jgi:hypothetical protein